MVCHGLPNTWHTSIIEFIDIYNNLQTPFSWTNDDHHTCVVGTCWDHRSWLARNQMEDPALPRSLCIADLVEGNTVYMKDETRCLQQWKGDNGWASLSLKTALVSQSLCQEFEELSRHSLQQVKPFLVCVPILTLCKHTYPPAGPPNKLLKLRQSKKQLGMRLCSRKLRKHGLIKWPFWHTLDTFSRGGYHLRCGYMARKHDHLIANADMPLELNSKIRFDEWTRLFESGMTN